MPTESKKQLQSDSFRTEFSNQSSVISFMISSIAGIKCFTLYGVVVKMWTVSLGGNGRVCYKIEE